MAMTDYERRKAAQARMTAYWVKRRADEAEVAKLTLSESQTEINADRSERVDEVNRQVAVAMLEKPAIPADTIHEVKAAMPVNVRTSSREYRIIANSDGQMVCESGPCLCGKGKREWHPICCKA